MTIFLQKENAFSSEKAHQMISYLEFTTLNHLIKNSEIYFDPKNNQTVVVSDQELLFLEEEQEYSPWVLRLTLDPLMMGRKAVTLKEIIAKIKEFFPDNLQVIESLETDDPIVIRLRLYKRSQYDFFDIKKIEQFLLHDMGIKGFFKKVSYRKEEVKKYTDKGVELEGPKEGQFILETTGTDLKKVLKLKGIDPTKTTSNHIMDIYNTLGIEAARQAIINEIQLVFMFFNIQVNDRHVYLLAEAICL